MSEHSREPARHAGGATSCLMALGSIVFVQDDFERADRLFDESATLAAAGADAAEGQPLRRTAARTMEGLLDANKTLRRAPHPWLEAGIRLETPNAGARAINGLGVPRSG